MDTKLAEALTRLPPNDCRGASDSSKGKALASPLSVRVDSGEVGEAGEARDAGPSTDRP